LVVISGSPASGKTVLAAELTRRLELPVIAHDTVRLGLADTMAVADLDQARSLGPAAWRVFYDLVGLMISGQASLIIEAHFHRGRSEMDLAKPVSESRAVLVHCVVDRSTALERVRRRVTDPARPRRLAIGDGGTMDRMESDRFEWDVYDEPPAFGVPTMTVDCSDGYVPSLDAVEVFVREATGEIG
jgi:predicted kinase